MRRRDFIKKSCLSCAGILGGISAVNILSGCTAIPALKITSKSSEIEIPENSFLPEQNPLIIKNSKLEFDILLVKKKDGTYNALYMQCSHESQPLSATKSGLYCSSHGSSFDLEGKVLLQPALTNLRKFKVEATNGIIKLYL